MENGINNSRMVNIFYDPNKLGQKGKNSGFVVTEKGENFPVMMEDSFCKADFCEPKMFCAMKIPSSDQVIKGMTTLVTITTLLNQLIDIVKDTAGKIPHKKNETNKPETSKTETEKTEYSEAA